MNSEKLRENKGNLCFSARPKYWEAGLKDALKFLEARMGRCWKEGSHVVKQTGYFFDPALGLRRLYLDVSLSVLDS